MSDCASLSRVVEGAGLQQTPRLGPPGLARQEVRTCGDEFSANMNSSTASSRKSTHVKYYVVCLCNFQEVKVAPFEVPDCASFLICALLGGGGFREHRAHFGSSSSYPGLHVPGLIVVLRGWSSEVAAV